MNLSERQLEVVKLLADGRTSKEIGEILNISQNTVQVHVNSAKLKFGAKNAVQLIAKAIREKVIQ